MHVRFRGEQKATQFIPEYTFHPSTYLEFQMGDREGSTHKASHAIDTLGAKCIPFYAPFAALTARKSAAERSIGRLKLNAYCRGKIQIA